MGFSDFFNFSDGNQNETSYNNKKTRTTSRSAVDDNNNKARSRTLEYAEEEDKVDEDITEVQESMPPAITRPPKTTFPSLMSITTSSPPDPLKTAVEIIENRLYFLALKSHPRIPFHETSLSGKSIHYFNIDTELVYWNFFLDFGPLNLGQLYRFSTKLNDKLSRNDWKEHIICFYSSTVPAKRTNGMYLICAWQVLYLNRTPEEAYAGFRNDSFVSSSPMPLTQNSSIPPKVGASSSMTTAAVPPFHDASPCACTFDLTILDCLRGLDKARLYGFFDYEHFDVEEYEHFEQVENGDLNWIVKDRILAFAGPHYKRNVSPEGYCTLTPADYIPYFQRKGVELVVRLNKKAYDENDFRRVDIRHVEHYYLDGSCPPMKILNQVVSSFETVPRDRAFAVHCKAGLGRTGTCIGAYLMKHYKFTAPEVIGWMRICRPGMVIGPQQHFLADIEQRMWHEGAVMNLRPTQDVKLLRTTTATAASTPLRRNGGSSGSSRRIIDMETDEDNDYSLSDEKKQQQDEKQGSPRSVAQAPLHFGSLNVKSGKGLSSTGGYSTSPSSYQFEAVNGRAGQADGLLSRRNKNKRSTASSSSTSLPTNRKLFDEDTM